MQALLLYPSESLCLFSAFSPRLPRCSADAQECISIKASVKASKFHPHRTQAVISFRNLYFSGGFLSLRAKGIGFCSREDVFGVENGGIEENGELELLNKPNPVLKTNDVPSEDENEGGKADRDEILEPFLKFFKPEGEVVESEASEEGEGVGVEYYDPKPGDVVVGLVVSGNENKLDVNIGADMLGTMLTKEILPLYDKELDYLLCDLKNDAKQFMVNGKMGIVKEGDGGDGDEPVNGEVSRTGGPVVEVGTVIFAEVLGRTLSGRPLLSSRRYFRRIAWHRVRQLKQINEPIEVKITEWNTGGLLTRIEGLRGFVPKQELVKKVNSFTELKENVGRRLLVQITRINQDKNDLILSQRAAWEKQYLREGTLLEGTVVKIFPYGAQVKLEDSNRRLVGSVLFLCCLRTHLKLNYDLLFVDEWCVWVSGLLHISNITRRRVGSVSDVLKVEEKVKVMVVKSLFPDKISLSIADLESEPGLFLSNRKKVYEEAEEMAKRYREKQGVTREAQPDGSGKALPMDTDMDMDKKEEELFANWGWFKFQTE